ncbi:hypothetical protein TNIN_283001 [Trichonephila inaurata madagascariensis]|uniref:Uncharacterized protein n=1 Tax=Trichonephila inaurata madagascariensis TaxID=2747483 RepID=A0A8X6YGB4_9ARAC|nr:hypothetical protein TNIN_283001 [Trichonephila inaurata madagascariensis]
MTDVLKLSLIICCYNSSHKTLYKHVSLEKENLFSGRIFQSQDCLFHRSHSPRGTEEQVVPCPPLKTFSRPFLYNPRQHFHPPFVSHRQKVNLHRHRTALHDQKPRGLGGLPSYCNLQSG